MRVFKAKRLVLPLCRSRSTRQSTSSALSSLPHLACNKSCIRDWDWCHLFSFFVTTLLTSITTMWALSASLLGLLAPANALLRFPCAQLVIDRLDPLVTPGQSPSPHLHQILGGVRDPTKTIRRGNADLSTGLFQHNDGSCERYAWRVYLYFVSVQ